MKLKILHLYPREMNLYGDHGNVLALKRRCEWRGIEVDVVPYEPGDKIPGGIDIVFGGGGQDSGQSRIADDFIAQRAVIEKLVRANVPSLFICGLYQLMGREFVTTEDEVIPGLGIFDMTTVAGKKRLIGNVTVDSALFGEIVGFENHSGQTTLDRPAEALGRVKKGDGNNGRDRTEGIILQNTIGTYLHGPILPQNPVITDFLIQQALTNRGDDSALAPLDDKYETAAHSSAAARPK